MSCHVSHLVSCLIFCFLKKKEKQKNKNCSFVHNLQDTQLRGQNKRLIPTSKSTRISRLYIYIYHVEGIYFQLLYFNKFLIKKVCCFYYYRRYNFINSSKLNDDHLNTIYSKLPPTIHLFLTLRIS